MPADTTTIPQAPVPAGAQMGRKRFPDPTADLVGQILPHLQRVKDDAAQYADAAAISHAKSGGKDPAQLDAAVKLYARADLFGKVIDQLLADPMLTPDVAQWWKDQTAQAS